MFVKRNKTKTKAEVTKQRTQKNKISLSTIVSEKTDTGYNNKPEEQMESLTFNCINMTPRDEVFVLINIKLHPQVASEDRHRGTREHTTSFYIP